MPTRIRPDREGYTGYACTGINQPCIDPMDDINNRFECLPKTTRKLVTDTPYEDLSTVADDVIVQAELVSCDTHFDPLNSGAFIDLYNVFRRQGLDGFLSTACVYEYARNTETGGADFPIEAESKSQVMYEPGFMDPPAKTIPGVGDAGGGGTTVTLNHPFKSRVKDGSPLTIEVGYLRPSWKDSITVEDPDTDLNVIITFAAVEEVVLPATDHYVYYDIWRNAGVWQAALEISEVWPPLAADTSLGNIIRQVGFAEYSTTLSGHIWHQHMYEVQAAQPVVPRGEFEAWYANDGYITIAAGTVETFNGDTTTTTEQTFDLSVDTEMWIQCTSGASGGAPSVGIADLQAGVYPGMYVSISEDVKHFNFKIGAIVGGAYVPAHKGRLHIDNTLLIANIDAYYTEYADSPRMMEFHDDQVMAVGDVLNDLLINSKFLHPAVRGGGVQNLIEGDELKIYGLTDESATVENTFDVEGVNGTAFGEGSVTLTPKEIEWEWDHGLVQTWEYGDGDTLEVAAGDNVKIEYVAGVVTISARDATVVTAKYSIEIDQDDLQLVGDEDAPGNDKVYGTDSVGTKGWYDAGGGAATHVQITVTTGVRLNVDGSFEKKERTVKVVDPGAESAWLDAGSLATLACEGGGDLEGQVAANTAQIALNVIAIADNTAAIALNTTHRTSDGTDHSDVVLNNTHRLSDGTDHSDVVLNTTHRTSDGTDHSDVVLNNTHRLSDGTDHANVVLNDTHRASDGTDHSDVVLNNTHRTSDGTDHANVVLNDTHRSSDGSDHANVGINTAAIALNTTHRTGDGSDHAAVALNTTHAGLTNNPHNVTKAQVGLGATEDGAEINNISDADAALLTGGTEITLHSHPGSAAGDVVGPASAVDSNFAVYDGTTGKLIKDGGATVSWVVDRANHTGTQLAATISDFDAEVSSNAAVAANTAKNTYPSADATKLAGIEALAEVNNISDANATALTDGGETSLHTHPGTGAGDVIGPASAVDGNIAMFDGTTGKLIADSLHSQTALGLSIAHYPLTTNPHNVTKAQVGLGSTEDGAEVNNISDANAALLTGGTEITLHSHPGSAAGDVIGPSSATDNAFARYDGTTGKLIKDAQTVEDASGNLIAQGTFFTGSVTNRGFFIDVANSFKYGFATSGTSLAIYCGLTSAQERIRIDSSGNVMIGTMAQVGAALLTVDGELYVDTNIVVGGTVDGRDVATDGTKLDGIEALAEVNNISDANAGLLTGGTEITLHSHPDTGSGDVVGPASAVDGNIAMFDGTTGKLIADSLHSQTALGLSIAHYPLTTNPHAVTKAQVGLGDVANTLHNLTATTAPTIGDDDADGYSIGSLWFDITNDKVYGCTDATTGVAIWVGLNNISDLNAEDLTNGNSSTLHYHTSDRARANHTGTQAAATISDFDTEVANNSAVAANTTHRGLTTGNPHSVTKAQVGLGDVANTLHKLDGTTAPTVNDDTGDGYTDGSMWFDVTNNKVYGCTDNSSGAAVWVGLAGGTAEGAFLDANNMIHVEDQKSSGTAGGSCVAGSWQTRDLNTVIKNTMTGASLSSDQITLPAGDYYIAARAPANECGQARIKLYNTSDASDVVIGSSARGGGGSSNIQIEAFLTGFFTITSEKTFELRMRNDQAEADGFGVASGFGDVEIYAQAEIWSLTPTSPTILKHNFAGTTAPSSGDDTTDGYSIGSNWFDINNDNAYVCTDASSGAAVWAIITSGATVGPTIKAWVRFNGDTLTIDRSYNVSSLTDIGNGQWRVNLTNAVSLNACCLVGGKDIDDEGVNNFRQINCRQTSTTGFYVGSAYGDSEQDAAVIYMTIIE